LYPPYHLSFTEMEAVFFLPFDLIFKNEKKTLQ